jgi:hypothetical protein
VPVDELGKLLNRPRMGSVLPLARFPVRDLQIAELFFNGHYELDTVEGVATIVGEEFIDQRVRQYVTLVDPQDLSE